MARRAARMLLGVVALAALAACTPEEADRPPPTAAAPVAVQTPAVPLSGLLGIYSGTVQSSQLVSLAPRVSGQLLAVHVDVGSAVRAGDALATLDPGGLQAQLLQAQASLLSAEARLNAMLAGPRPADVAAAQSQLEAAQARLTQLLRPSAADIAAADATLAAAQAASTNAEASAANARATLLGQFFVACRPTVTFGVPCHATDLPLPPDVADGIAASLQSGVGALNTDAGARAAALLNANAAYRIALSNQVSAEQALRAAQARRDTVGNPTTAELAAQRSAVEAARSALESKQQPYTEADLQSARATLAQAQAALAVARTNLDQTVVKAPFDGVIASRMLNVGTSATPATPVFTLVGRGVEVAFAVEESIAAQVRPGQQAEVSVAALAANTFRGEVSTVSPVADARTHLVDMRVRVQDPETLLKHGMAARVALLTTAR